MSIKPPSKSVFVGNIPYGKHVTLLLRSITNAHIHRPGLTEEQITDIFSSAGKVLNFRLVYDRETGRPKGFGFAEYPDAGRSHSASSAVRNLNDYEIMNRKLRVDFSNDGAEDDTAAPPGYQHPPLPSNGFPVPQPASSQNGSLPQLPQGIDLPPGLTCPDAISRTLNTLPPAQLLDVLSQMKALVSADQAKATELLRQAPQLSYAIFQALLLMGLVSTEALGSVVQAASAPPPAAVAPVPVPQQYPPPMPTQAAFAPGYIGTPPVHGLAYPPPPPQQQPQQQYQPPRAQPPAPAQPAPAAGLDTDALVQQVMSMPQSVIDALKPDERAQILTLRATFAAQGLGR
ncbi:MAG: hypothetical protein M1818_005880 [Claussenomyces sp. TS43310]|nr:MAG: hypothetical protein M1818_005880 [Claussenomyces sp. TS43310]